MCTALSPLQYGDDEGIFPQVLPAGTPPPPLPRLNRSVGSCFQQIAVKILEPSRRLMYTCTAPDRSPVDSILRELKPRLFSDFQVHDSACLIRRNFPYKTFRGEHWSLLSGRLWDRGCLTQNPPTVGI